MPFSKELNACSGLSIIGSLCELNDVFNKRGIPESL